MIDIIKTAKKYVLQIIVIVSVVAPCICMYICYSITLDVDISFVYTLFITFLQGGLIMIIYIIKELIRKRKNENINLEDLQWKNDYKNALKELSGI